MSAESWKRLHLFGMAVWIVLVIPSILLWAESLLWIIFISLYANICTHFSAYQSARAEKIVESDHA